MVPEKKMKTEAEGKRGNEKEREKGKENSQNCPMTASERARRDCRSYSRDRHTRDNDRQGAAIAGSSTRLQKHVSQALQRMDLAVEEEYRCPKSGYSIDIRVRKSTARGLSEREGLAVKVDGPSHFLSCKSPTGATLIKRRLLQLLGYNLVSVPYWEWAEMRQDKRAQEAYLRCRLAVQGGGT